MAMALARRCAPSPETGRRHDALEHGTNGRRRGALGQAYACPCMHNTRRNIGLVPPQGETYEGDAMGERFHDRPVTTLRDDGCHLGEDQRMRDKGGQDHVGWRLELLMRHGRAKGDEPPDW
jgi:hypothetical protein